MFSKMLRLTGYITLNSTQEMGDWQLKNYGESCP